MTQNWDPVLYDTKHSFVAALGESLLEVLNAKAGERILDLGCGTGDHVAQLRERGVDAMGVDSSRAMIERARAKYPDMPFSVTDARSLAFEGEFDGIVSNAALHWMPEASEVARSMARALKPGGRLVAELGGAGNVSHIIETMNAVRRERRLPEATSPWYFPTIGQYASVLEAAGLEVKQASLFDRPTRLDEEDGLATWVRMFGAHLLSGLTDVEDALSECSTRLRPLLHRKGHWYADYRRLRIVACRTTSSKV